MRERTDHLARLGTANIEISGGEPLLHPELDELIRHIRGTGALAGVITNGYSFVAPTSPRARPCADTDAAGGM